MLGPFVINSDSKINKIQLMKDKYCLNLVFNMNGNGDLSLNIGFDDSNKALEWQDHCEKVKQVNQTEEKPS